jgi:dienelactone hydrolase
MSIHHPRTLHGQPIRFLPRSRPGNTIWLPLNPGPLFAAAELPVCSSDCELAADPPTLLFSPGYTGSRLLYSLVASAIASYGFTVITMDHPDKAPVIVYSDGHAAYANASAVPTEAELAQYVDTRAADALFIIDQLANATAVAELLPHRGPKVFDTTQFAMLGHSLGGSTAFTAAGLDSRIRGAINWDGTLYGRLPASGLEQPMLFIASPRPQDASWVAAWPTLHGPKLWVEIANVTHQALLDGLSLFEAAGARGPELNMALGSIGAAQLVSILSEYTAEWMKGVFSGQVGGPLLEGERGDEFPEVKTVMRGNY